jgi:hypothetical protein
MLILESEIFPVLLARYNAYVFELLKVIFDNVRPLIYSRNTGEVPPENEELVIATLELPVP